MKINKNKIIQITVSIIITVLIFLQLDFKNFKSINFDFNIFILIFLLFLVFFSIFIRAFRWKIIMNENQEWKISTIISVKISFVGTALNMLLPAGVGEIAKSYFGYKWVGIKERMFSVSLFDKLLAIASLFFLAIYSFYYQNNYLFLLAGFFCLTPYLILVYFDFFLKIPLFNKIYTFFSKKIKKIDFNEIVKNSKVSIKIKFIAFILSLIGWIFTYILLYICFNILNLDISILKVIAIGPILTIGRLFPFTLNGFGTDEALIIFFFANNSNSNETILVAALIYRFATLIIPAIVGVIMILITKKHEKTTYIHSKQ